MTLDAGFGPLVDRRQWRRVTRFAADDEGCWMKTTSNQTVFRSRIISNLNESRNLLSILVFYLSKSALSATDRRMVWSLCSWRSDPETKVLIELVKYMMTLVSHTDDIVNIDSSGKYFSELRVISEGLKNAVCGDELDAGVFKNSVNVSFMRWCIKNIVGFMKFTGNDQFVRNMEKFWALLEFSHLESSECILFDAAQFENIGHLVSYKALELSAGMSTINQKPKFVMEPTESQNNYLKSLVVQDVGVVEKSTLDRVRYYYMPLGMLPVLRGDEFETSLGSIISNSFDQYYSKNFKNIVELDDGTIKKCVDELRSIGVHNLNNIVLIHVRETNRRNHLGYHVLTEVRNAKIETYYLAVRYLVSRGYQIIRMGDSGMMPSRPIEGMLDYPFSNIKSDYMDIFLSSICKMMIGTSSGMSHVPMLFNKRILYTNWMPFGDFLFSRKSMTITKTLYRNGDRIPFLTMNREFRGVYNRLLFDLNDVVVVDNSPEDILQAVQDMEKYPDGEIDYSNPLKVRIAPSFAKKMGIL